MISLKKIDLSKASKHECPSIKIGATEYLAIINKELYFGSFSKEWYGLNFDCDYGVSGIQFDAPGYNSSEWQELYEIVKS